MSLVFREWKGRRFEIDTEDHKKSREILELCEVEDRDWIKVPKGSTGARFEDVEGYLLATWTGEVSSSVWEKVIRHGEPDEYGHGNQKWYGRDDFVDPLVELEID